MDREKQPLHERKPATNEREALHDLITALDGLKGSSVHLNQHREDALNRARAIYAASTPLKIEMLQELARTVVGDNCDPNLFFVTDDSAVVMVTHDREAAYAHWRVLASRFPRRECALEDRKTGVLACVEPESDELNARLVTRDMQ
jgi:hypothetical protein